MQNLYKTFHFWLHTDFLKIRLTDQSEWIEINRDLPDRPYLEYESGRYERASSNTPGRAGQLVRYGNQVTICMFTGKPWVLIINGVLDGI
jgi:hypothetical protein